MNQFLFYTDLTTPKHLAIKWLELSKLRIKQKLHN